MAAKSVVGLDEVGRGCWAGPLVAAAVLLDHHIEGLRDSKKISAAKRLVLSAQIKEQSEGYGIGWVSACEVDTLGLTASVRLAMLRAMKRLHETVKNYDEIIIDGNINFLRNTRGLSTDRIQTIVRADDSIPAVSAASIIAKVARDQFMQNAAIEYPGYGFERHVGYGTASHHEALMELGVCELHRQSFAPIKKLLE